MFSSVFFEEFEGGGLVGAAPYTSELFFSFSVAVSCFFSASRLTIDCWEVRLKDKSCFNSPLFSAMSEADPSSAGTFKTEEVFSLLQYAERSVGMNNCGVGVDVRGRVVQAVLSVWLYLRQNR